MTAPASLIQLRNEAKHALAVRLPGVSSKERQAWLAERMGIEIRYCIIADMDATECETVKALCAETPRKRRKA